MHQPNVGEAIRVIHELMIEAELRRHHPERQRRSRDLDRTGILAGIRRVAARGLIALGTRLDPSAGMPAATASGLRA